MLENIAYVGLGFVAVLFGLEAAWHFTACKIKDKSIRPCLYKQMDINNERTNRLNAAA
jgi:hypothetical protein